MWRKAIRILIWIAIVCGALTGLVLAFFEPWTVPGDDAQFAVSLEPSLSPGDFVLVTRASGSSDGALVRCADPDAPGRFVVGRVIGRTGDKVAFNRGSLLVNGKTPSAPAGCDTVHVKNPATQEDEDLSCSLEEFAGDTHPVLRASSTAAAARDTSTDVEVGRIYLVSDDRVLHMDSRDYGTVLPATCQHIALRFWGQSGWGDAKKRLTVLW